MDSSEQSFVSSAAATVARVTWLCQRLRELSQVDILANWSICREGGSVAADLSQWQQIVPNEKGQIGWERGRQTIWLGQRLVLPAALNGYPLTGLSCRLALTWWAEVAEVFVNGVLVQTGDLFDHSPRILLTPAVAAGEAIDVRLRLVSPGHDLGALMRSRLVYESADATNPEPGWVADELMVVVKQVAIHPTSLDALESAIEQIDYDLLTTDRDRFSQHLLEIVLQVRAIVPATLSRIYLLGHAHLDMAWLWEVAETWEVAERTFSSALDLQQAFPHLTFCHSTPALYEWIERQRPELFDRILQQLRAGTWEIVGGMWIEPDLNLISGESIARQLIYGQQYNRSRFGVDTRVAWLPDTFGFCWQLPQLLLQGGIDYFVTQKFQWNDTTKPPHQLFWWEAPDGSRVLSLMSSEIGEGIDPLKMIDYAGNWQQNTGIDESLWLFGVGDHGGGPTRDMLELAERWSHSEVFPDLEFTTALAYLNRLASRADSHALPVWRDELYLEFHRGCYTTHADQKRSNRQCEDLLYQAELWSVLACILDRQPYPAALQVQLETAWKQTLFNQFHDIIPGTAIAPVYVTANAEWANVERVTTQIISTALSQIGERISLPTPPSAAALPTIVFNALNWQRQQVVSLAVPHDTQWQVWDADGNILPSQSATGQILFDADLPSIGYRLFWLVPIVASPPIVTAPTDWTLENQFVRIGVDPQTGDLASIWDKVAQREVLSAHGNQLQAFADGGQYWDAWNIDPEYAAKQLAPSQLKSIEWIETGAIRQRLRVIRMLAGAEFSQDYILDVHSPILQINTSVDWQAEHVLVKANFPLNLTADRATYEIACGAIERPTKPETAAERAKWEVPAHRWADLTDNSGADGVSLLNDCKYGYDAGSDYLRLTLLRSSTWPDPNADRGYHEFSYAIYPHAGSWQAAATVRKGYELNSPLQVLQLAPLDSTKTTGDLPAVNCLLDLGAPNLVLMAVKPSAHPAQPWVIRFYECHGSAAKLDLSGSLGLQLDRVVNLFDEPITDRPPSFKPWQIQSFGVDRTASDRFI